MTDASNDRNEPTLLNSREVGLPFFRLVIRQYRYCYFNSLKRTFCFLIGPSVFFLVGVLFLLSDELFPGMVRNYFWSVWFLISCGQILFMPLGVKIVAEDQLTSQFGLRSLLIVITLLCLLMAAVTGAVRYAGATSQRRLDVSQQIEALAGDHYFTFNTATSNVRELMISGVTDQDVKDLVAMSAMEKVVELDLDASQISDNALRELAKLKHLRQLTIINASVTQSEVDRLQQALPNCVILW